MNLEDIYKELDSLYGINQGKDIESFLMTKIGEAVEASAEDVIVALLNELIGYYRESGDAQKCVAYSQKLLNIVENGQFHGTMVEATSRLNVATGFRSAGLLKESNGLYQQVKAYYDVNVAPDSMMFASLYNNMSLLFQEMGDYESAADCLERALGIALSHPECQVEQATSYANLATTLIKLDRVEEAIANLEQSLAIFEQDDNPDYHYCAALSAMAEIKYSLKEYEEAIYYYEKSLRHIEMKMGRNKGYDITASNLAIVKKEYEDYLVATFGDKDSLVEKIVGLEWEAFDKVINEGGRASCQDDFITFSIMRKSQYQTWNVQMLISYINDFESANANGWNLITEKYGRMEKSTAPARYETIKDSLPPISEKKEQIIEAIVGIQVKMMEEFAEKYPKSACQARSIHTYEDNPFNTSYETYLRGEISTYSDGTLDLYGRFVARCAAEGINIARMTIENSAKLYGFSSVDELESKL